MTKYSFNTCNDSRKVAISLWAAKNKPYPYEYQAYLYYEYALTNSKEIHKELIDEEYLILDGSKYVLTEKGEGFLKDYDVYIQIHRNKTIDLSFDEFDDVLASIGPIEGDTFTMLWTALLYYANSESDLQFAQRRYSNMAHLAQKSKRLQEAANAFLVCYCINKFGKGQDRGLASFQLHHIRELKSYYDDENLRLISTHLENMGIKKGIVALSNEIHRIVQEEHPQISETKQDVVSDSSCPLRMSYCSIEGVPEEYIESVLQHHNESIAKLKADEIAFLNAVVEHSNQFRLKPELFEFERLSDGRIRIYYDGCWIVQFKCGRKGCKFGYNFTEYKEITYDKLALDSNILNTICNIAIETHDFKRYSSNIEQDKITVAEQANRNLDSGRKQLKFILAIMCIAALLALIF